MTTKKTLPLSPTTSHKMAAKPNSKQHMGWTLILPALLSVMTRNIIKVIDDKLSSLTKTIQMLDAQIQDTNGPLDEVDARLLAADKQEPRVVELEKQVRSAPSLRGWTWLPHVLKMTTKADCMKLESARRTLAPKPESNRRPRPLLLRFYMFSDKPGVTEAACSASQDGGFIKLQ